MTIQYLFPCFFDLEKNCNIDNKPLVDYAYKNVCSSVNVSNVGGYQSANLNLDDTNLNPLCTLVETKSLNLCKNLNIKNKIKITSMWFNINKKGNYNQAHAHSGFISGVFYVKTNPNSGQIVFRHPSQLHPYFMKDIEVNEYHPSIANEWFFDPADCDLYLFPSYLEHYVLPNNTDEDRISFAFNIDILTN